MATIQTPHGDVEMKRTSRHWPKSFFLIITVETESGRKSGTHNMERLLDYDVDLKERSDITFDVIQIAVESWFNLYDNYDIHSVEDIEVEERRLIRQIEDED